MKLRTTQGILLFVGVIAAAPTSAQTPYPSKPLRWILTQPPGGANDVLARPITSRMAETIGQQIVIDNRGGAGGQIGAEVAAKSPPDGYTMVQLSISHAVGTTLYKKITKYDLLRDLAPVTMLATVAGVLVVHPSLPVRSVKELILLARAQPQKISYSTSGSGTPNHLAAEMFNHLAGVKLIHVPYKGGSSSVIALISGEISLSFASMPAAIPHIRSNRLRALAVTTAQRVQSASVSNLPTMIESGVAGFEAETWFGLSVPTGTPRDIVTKLNAETARVLKMPEVIQQLDQSGFQVRVSTPEEYAAFTRSEIDKWARVVQVANIHAD
jgi:tripartite-type tricarboxylate transporter receptor subunit TctC